LEVDGFFRHTVPPGQRGNEHARLESGGSLVNTPEISISGAGCNEKNGMKHYEEEIRIVT
jgi:hypothetical protein